MLNLLDQGRLYFRWTNTLRTGTVDAYIESHKVCKLTRNQILTPISCGSSEAALGKWLPLLDYKDFAWIHITKTVTTTDLSETGEFVLIDAP